MAKFLGIGLSTSPYICAYSWSGGWGTRQSAPTTLPNSITNRARFIANRAILTANDSSPYLNAWTWSDSGFGSKYSDPSTIPGSTAASFVGFNKKTSSIAVTNNTSPRIYAYPWSNGFGTKHTDPAAAVGSNAQGLAFRNSDTNDAIVVGQSSTPYLKAYPWSSSGFGTAYSDPSTLPAAQCYGGEFAPSGNAVAMGSSATGVRLYVYAWSSSGFGSKYANPATVPAGASQYPQFSPKGDYLIVGHSTTPFVSVYPWSDSTGFGTKLSNPSTTNGANTRDNAVNSEDIALGQIPNGVVSPVAVFPWSSSGFGTRYAEPSTTVDSAKTATA